MWKQVHSFTEWLLNKYLARYLSNVNLHQVHIGLTQGSVELENLKLREDALENFNLPFKIVDGTVGKLELQVPVSGLSSGSLVLCLSDLNIRASPYQGTEYDPAKEEEQRLAALNVKLEALEQQIYQRLYAQSQSWLSSFASSYFTSMIENLKLVINDVHFCYEDTVSVPAMPFYLGITIKHLATQPSASPNKSTQWVLKEVQLEGLGVYWNFGASNAEEEKCYVLEPISAKVELTQNKSTQPLNSLQTPRFTASLTLQTFQLTLSSRQYHMTAQILNIIDWQRRKKLNRKWHPGVPVHGNVAAWWKFAISAVSAPISRRMQRERSTFVSARAKLLVQYVDLYAKMLSKHEIKDLIKQDIKPLEEGLTYDEIYVMRSLALNRIQRMSPPLTPHQQQSSGWTSWVPGWGWGYQSQTASSPSEESPAEEEPVDYSLFFNKDSVFGKVSAKLLHGSIQLLEFEPSGAHRELVRFSFADLAVGAEYRMKTDTIIVSASLQDIALDNQCQHSSLFPHVVSRSKLRGEPQVPQPVLDVHYELNPVSAALDLLLRVTTQPIDIVYNEDIIDRVTNFFALDPTIDFVVEAALARLGELRSKTKHQLRSTIDKIFSGKLRDFRRWDILLKIQAPLLILPESFHDDNSAVVIMDLGQVVIDNMSGLRPRQEPLRSDTVSRSDHTRSDTNGSDSAFSTPPSTPNSSLPDIPTYFSQPAPSNNNQPVPNYPSRSLSPGSTSSQSADSLYETFSLQLSDLKVHAGMFHDMIQCDLQNRGRIMDRLSLNMKLERRLVFSLDPLHPNILVSANVPKIAFQLDVDNMKCLVRALRSVRSGDKPDRHAGHVTAEEDEEEEEDSGGVLTPSISASLQSSMKPETLMHTHLIDVKVHIEKISTTIQHGHQLDLELHIDDVELAYTKQPFDSELSLLISTLTICDRTQQFQDESYMMATSFPFADTKAEELRWCSSVDSTEFQTQPDALIMVQISEIGPDYPGSDKAVGTRNVDVRLNYLDLLPHHTTLAHLLGFFKRVSLSRSREMRLSETREEDVETRSRSVEEWRYHIKMTVEHVSLGLLDPRSSRTKIGTAAMLGVTLDLKREGRTQDVRFGVGRIQLRELDSEKCVLGLGNMEQDSDSHQALSITLTKSTCRDVTAARDTKFRHVTSVDVLVGSLRYFHSPAFTSAVISSVNSLLLLVEEQVSQISSKASEAANRVMSSGVQGSEQVHFTVLIESPVVQLPRGQESRDILVGHLGNVTIRNMYCEEEEQKMDVDEEEEDSSTETGEVGDMGEGEKRQRSTVHKVCVDIDNIHLYSAKLPTSASDLSIDDKPILHDTTFNVCIEQRQVLLHDKLSGVQTKISAEIPQGLKVSLSKRLYEQILETMRYATSLRGPAKRVRTSSSQAQPDLDSSSESLHRTVVKEIKSDFVLPVVLIQLQGDLLDTSTPNLAQIKFEDFTISWTKVEETKDLYITLHKLNIIDMLEPPDSPAKFLLKSRHRARLPASISSSTGLLFTPSKRRQSDTAAMSPYKKESDMKALVSIRIFDNTAKEEGERDGKCVVVDLNCVDVTVNLQTWVMLLDFMTISPTVNEKVVRGSQAVSDFLNDMSDPNKVNELDSSLEEEKSSETTVCVSMKELNITLNKREYPLALCLIEGVALELTLGSNQVECQGRMLGLSVKDLSPCAGLYKDKFTVLGNEVLQFDFKKCTKEDRDLLREYDSSLTLHMSSIRYVHTKRFLAETLAFLDHFIVLDTSLQVNRNAVITGTYQAVPKHGHRILLDVQMSSPVVVVPVTPSSAHVLVGYPGNIAVSNSFRFATTEETLASTLESGRERNSKPCLLDCLDIKLRDMDVVSAVWDSSEIRHVTSLLYEKCLLTLLVRRNLDSSFNHSSPNLCVRGELSTTGIRITEADLAKVKGFLSYNLSEDIEEFVISREHITDTVNVHKLDLDGMRCWLDVDIAIQLDNVSIELLHRKTDRSLAKFYLTTSVLAFQTYSNKHSVVKLTSRLLTVEDTRPASGNSFPLVVTHRDSFEPESLQVEINMRNTPEKKHWSFVLNKVKVHGVMDFLTLVKVFLTSDVSSPERLLKEHITGLPPVAPAPVKEVDKRDFDINVSVISTELVLPETCTQPDSQAVVLQLTTVVVLKQQFYTRPKLSVTFEDVQMFSCTCGSPDTALSIVDVGAMSVELRHDLGSSRSLRSGALLESTQSSALELQLENLNTKLSYQDALLFYNILESVKRQLHTALVIASDLQTPHTDVPVDVIETTEAVTTTTVEQSDNTPDNKVNLVGVEVKCNSVSLCVIDDYGDRDIPLLRVVLAGLHLWYDMKDVSSLSNTLGVDYYNSYVSGWEPLVEPWKVDLHYVSTPQYSTIKVDAASTLNLNLTHSFCKLALTTVERLKPVLKQEVSVDRKVVRKPFIPFLIRNQTGHELRFARETRTHPLNDPNPFSSIRPRCVQSEWTSVGHGEEAMFTFVEGGRRLKRHKVSNALQSRSLRVCVGSWEEMTNISVDKVGRFFRDPKYTGHRYGGDQTDSIRIVYDLILEEGARKCITVHSGLTIQNETELGIEVLLENATSPATPSQLLPLLSPGEQCHVPVDKVDWLIRVRPHAMGYLYSRSLKWRTSLTMNDLYDCTFANISGDKLYMVAVIERGNYPKGDYLPGHTITLRTPVRLCNSLPVELTYKLLAGDTEKRGGVIPHSQSLSFYDINPSTDISCAFQLEGFPQFYKLQFPYLGTSTSRKTFMTSDERERKLPIHVRCEIVNKFCWKIVLYVKYVVVNLTVYPIVFAQQNAGEEAACQYEAHEAARSLHPLMFDYCNEAQPRRLSLRIGKEYRKIRPHWSAGIDLTKPLGLVSLKCAQGQMRPDKVFDLSYECSVGSGLFSNTTTVRIVSRYHLENHSSQRLLYAQWYQVNNHTLMAESSDWTPDTEPVIEAAPNSIMPFTWPRNDLDQLLSICIPDIVDCGWSGGFCINNPQSSVVSMRGTGGRKIFLQCTVVLQRSSYHVVFSDFNDLPTPYRIENHSMVSVEYRQSESLSDMSTLGPGDWCPYHWDEPVLKPHELDLRVTGGEPMKVMITPSPYTHLSALVYENAVYLALTDTWEGGAPTMRDIPLNQLSSASFRAIRVDEKLPNSSSRLVLDVPQGVQVLVKQYNPHSLSQLWQVKESGQLMHYKTKMFLDIPGRAPNPGTYASLIVKPPDNTRHQTQSWTFQDSGYLTCKLPGLAVCPRNGLMHDGSDAVLDMISKNPPHINFYKRRPGCGAVLVKTSLDGPTIVIKLLDAITGEQTVYKDISTKEDTTVEPFQLQVKLLGGIGLSLINHVPEEILYVSMTGLSFDAERAGSRTTVVFDLVGFQADNQCREALVPVVMHPVMREGEHTVHIRVIREVRGDGRLVVYPEVQALFANLSSQLDEVLLLKLIQFYEMATDSQKEDPRYDPEAEYKLSTRKLEYNPVLVESMLIHETQVNVSLIVAPVLEDDLKDIHTRLGLRSYLNFSDVTFVLKKYHTSNVIAATSTIRDSIIRHYRDCAFGHKLQIVLNSEMTGNMGGLFNDLLSGLSVGLDGDVSGMVKSVAHGMSDTASKLSSTASTVLTYVSGDDAFRADRDRLRASRYQSSSASLRAGWQGLRSGLIGGITSIPSSVVRGINEDGVTGAVTGLAKGLIGTVAKPAAGLLDFASGTTLAITQSTRSSESIGEVKRARLPRCCTGEILAPYSLDTAQGMATLWKLNRKSRDERFISWSVVNTQLKVLVSSERVRLIERESGNKVVKEISLDTIGQCAYLPRNSGGSTEHHLAIQIYDTLPPPGVVNLPPDSCPRLNCNSQKTSLKISQDIQYAIDLRRETAFLVNSGKNFVNKRGTGR